MDEEIVNIWEKALEDLKKETSPIAYNTYIKNLVPSLVNKNTICFSSPSQYHMEICKTKYLSLIQSALNDLTHIDYQILFEIKDTVKEEQNKKESMDNEEASFIPPQPKENKLNLKEIKEAAGLNQIEEYTFDSFVVGSNNRFAHATAVSVSQNLGKTNPLYIYGGVGLGKTHLMQAIGNYVLDMDPTKKVMYCTGESFVSELIKVMLNSSLSDEFKQKYRNVDLLLVDDVQIIAGKDKCQEEFFHTFNTLFDNGKQIILTSEKPPKDINGLEDRLKTRFLQGVSVDIQTPDYETRLAILKKRAQEERYIVKDNILENIASKVKSNVRELNGVLKKLILYSKFTNEPITDEVVENIIESVIVASTNVMTSKLIMQVVAKFFNIRVTDITSDKRSNTIAFPRQIAMYLCREVADMAFTQIGKDFGGRDHSTVLHAYSKIKDDYDNNPDTRDLIDDIKKELEREN